MIKTADEFLNDLFEYENCAECGQGKENHVVIPLLGNWFAKCEISRVRATMESLREGNHKPILRLLLDVNNSQWSLTNAEQREIESAL
jgi:hypothetical protein